MQACLRTLDGMNMRLWQEALDAWSALQGESTKVQVALCWHPTSQPYAVQPLEPDSPNNFICPICQGFFYALTSFYVLQCFHRFHIYCVLNYPPRSASCPLYKVNIPHALYMVLDLRDMYPGLWGIQLSWKALALRPRYRPRAEGLWTCPRQDSLSCTFCCTKACYA